MSPINTSKARVDSFGYTNNMALIIWLGVLAVLVVIGIIVKSIRDKFSRLSYQNRLLNALRRLDVVALSTTDLKIMCQEIVNAVHVELGYFFSSIALVDEQASGIRRIAISNNPGIKDILESVPIQYTKQLIPFTLKHNLLIKVVNERKSAYTNKLYDIQEGIFPQETSNEIQGILKIKGLFAYPLIARNNKVLGVIHYAHITVKEKLSEFEYLIMQQFTDEVSRALDNIFLNLNLRDTTEQLAQANQRLKELDHLKDDFVSIASHELRTPMTAIRSYAWMALHKSGISLPDKVEKYLVRVLMSTERLINLVNDMLNISRIESGKIEINPEPVDLIALTEDIIDEVYYSKSTEKKFHFVLLEKPIPKVFADPEKLRQVFLNLVGNSLKFTPVGGKIIFDFFTDGKVVETSVKDTGVGISKDDLSKLFHKFSRLDNSYTAVSTSGGTGLGLYISKNLIELMHGNIRAQSEGIDKGSTFTFSLPVASPEVLKNASQYQIKPQGEVKGLEPVAL